MIRTGTEEKTNGLSLSLGEFARMGRVGGRLIKRGHKKGDGVLVPSERQPAARIRVDHAGGYGQVRVRVLDVVST